MKLSAHSSDPNYARPLQGVLWSPADVEIIELDASHREIARALDARDDAAIWSGYRKARDPEQYLDWLCSLAGNRIYEDRHPRYGERSTTWYQSLFVVPVLLGPPFASTVESSQGLPSRAVLSALQAWVGQEQKVSLVKELVSYEDLYQWSPITQRDVLGAMCGEAPLVVVKGSQAGPEVESDLPRLAFVVGACRRWLQWPSLPEPGRAADICLMASMRGLIQYGAGRPVLDARLPMAVQDGVLAGLQMWVESVVRIRDVTGWSIEPSTPERLSLDLMPRGEDSAIRLSMRRHQLGPYAGDFLAAWLWNEIGPATP